MMRKNIYALLVLLMVTGCAGISGRQSRDGATSAGGRYAQRSCPDADAVLGSVRRGKESVVPAREACAGDRLRFVAQQLLNGEARFDTMRIQLELANAQLRQEPAEGLSGLSLLLSVQLNERRRHDESLQKSNAQLLEQQHRADELAAKLDALRQIEQSMVNKASKKKIQP
ncbi:hypothetical protein [Aquitalea magnusonii]|jgi:hypothetical protein|uniref:hypothetical protein n=1 Tax=Aquitalea magnusonii TaxID=332411 RepID=UPI0011AE319C|nr:hypothetical protein [Aquitalea magnusonii]